MEENKKDGGKNIVTSIAIVVAGILVAGAVIYGNGKAPSNPTDQNLDQEKTAQVSEHTNNVRPISSDDHIRGNPDASIIIVEYSDFECPFCKRFHDTMNQVMDEYGESGKVAWVYRHFPLDSLHPIKARAEAVASECANELGGPDMFWKYTDRLYELSETNNKTNIEVVLPQIAQELGLDEQKFNTCLSSGKYDDRINADMANAIETGGQGTPWSVIITSDGQTFPLSGAQPYESIKQLIEIATSS